MKTKARKLKVNRRHAGWGLVAASLIGILVLPLLLVLVLGLGGYFLANGDMFKKLSKKKGKS